MGKVRLFAHPHNPDALAAAGAGPQAPAKRQSAKAPSASLPLRSGSLVAEGTVLGHVSHPPGATDGHLRFAIRPAGDPRHDRPSADPRKLGEARRGASPAGGKDGPEPVRRHRLSEAFLLSKSRLRSRDPVGPGHRRCRPARRARIASGEIDKRALAVLSFLSRSGLKPTVGTLACGAGQFASAGYVPAEPRGLRHRDHEDQRHRRGRPPGLGLVTDTTIRTLLTLPGQFAPHQIVSLMRYPGAREHARALRPRPLHRDRLSLDRSRASAAKAASATTTAQHSAPTAAGAPSP